MMNVAEYLSNYREEEPTWLGRHLRNEQVTFKDIMSSRVAYYPGSGYDGTLMKVGNMSHSVHSFLYVDYLLKRSDLERHIAQKNSIRGYHPIGKIVSIRSPSTRNRCFSILTPLSIQTRSHIASR